MKSFLLKRLPVLMSICALLFAFVLLVAFGPAGAPSPVAAQGDGRINVVAHFGGDALYCVGPNGMPTSNFSEFLHGGFRVLSMNGTQEWFVPASVINPKIAEAQSNGGQGVLVAQGQGTYGPATLYVFVDSTGTVKFTYTGVDEWGKSNSLTWSLCLPVNPPSDPGSHSSGVGCTASGVGDHIQDAYD